MPSHVLIVDDVPEVRDAIGSALTASGYRCELAADAFAGLEIVNHQTIDVVVSAIVMDRMSGLELLERIKHSHPTLPFIAITPVGGIHEAVDAIKHGAFECVMDPCAKELLPIVARAIETREHEHADRPMSLELVGTGPAMQKLQQAMDDVARSCAPVLVTGETGTGKELVARGIHARSSRRHRPFVAVNMSAIPIDLLEAELFGHVRGAFTGAALTRKGLFTEADGGTLLLDEIGDMPSSLQAKLLRVLQFGEIRPVGGERTHRVDVRVIAATHQSLPTRVKEGRFREDLYFRLNVLPIVVPPLRDRREDIPALVEHLLAQARLRAPLSPVQSIEPDTLTKLCEAPWRGNVRELASVIERAVVFGADEISDSSQLSRSVTHDALIRDWSFPSDAPITLRQLSIVYTNWVLAQTSGDKERAAEILGINLSTLYRWQRQRVALNEDVGSYAQEKGELSRSIG
jgi:two-component system response regulator HydG